MNLFFDGNPAFIVKGNPIVLSSTDYTIYANGWNDVEEYSTSEVKTNKVWIDGKPIYRKVVAYATSMTINNLSYLVNARPIYHNDLYFGFYYYDSPNHEGLHIRGDTISIDRAGNLVPIDYYVFEYTKTTD